MLSQLALHLPDEENTQQPPRACGVGHCNRCGAFKCKPGAKYRGGTPGGKSGSQLSRAAAVGAKRARAGKLARNGAALARSAERTKPRREAGNGDAGGVRRRRVCNRYSVLR